MTQLRRIAAAAAGRPWTTLWAGLVALVVLSAAFGRFLEWDESVFYSQSGGLPGIPTEPLRMAASREIGPAALISLLRIPAADVATLRLIWALATITLLVLAFREVGRSIDPLRAVIGAAFFGSTWLVLQYYSAFYGSLLGACLSVAIVGIYLSLRSGGRPGTASDGLLLGLTVAGSFWFRHIESAIVVAVILVHSLTGGAALWRRAWRSVAVAVPTFLLAFALPWAIDSAARYGSVSERLTAARSQGWETGLVNRMPDYVRAIFGESTHYPALSDLADRLIWGRVLQVAVVLLVAALGVISLWRARVERRDGPSLAWLFAALAAASFAFFFFYASNTQDRYLMYGLAFSSLLVGWGVHDGADWFRLRMTPRPFGGGVLVVVAVWVISQLLIFTPYEAKRVIDNGETAAVGQTIRTLASAQPCQGVARYGAPQLQLGSGCTFRSIGSVEEAEEALRDFAADSEPRFVVVPESVGAELQIPEGWLILSRDRAHGATVLILTQEHQVARAGDVQALLQGQEPVTSTRRPDSENADG